MEKEDILLEIKRDEIDRFKEEEGLKGKDEAAQFIAVFGLLMERARETLRKEFGERAAICKLLNSAQSMLMSIGLYRTEEDIWVSDSYPCDGTDEDGVELHWDNYIFTIPCRWENEVEDEEEEGVVTECPRLTGMLSIFGDRDDEMHVFPRFILSDSVVDKNLAVKCFEKEGGFDIKDGSFSAIFNGLMGAARKMYKECRNPKEKTFCKFLSRHVDRDMLLHLFYLSGNPMDDDFVLVFDNLTSIDPILKDCVNDIRHPKSGGKPKLTDEEIRMCLARYNYEGTPEWIEKIMDDKVSLLGQG